GGRAESPCRRRLSDQREDYDQGGSASGRSCDQVAAQAEAGRADPPLCRGRNVGRPPEEVARCLGCNTFGIVFASSLYARGTVGNSSRKLLLMNYRASLQPLVSYKAFAEQTLLPGQAGLGDKKS